MILQLGCAVLTVPWWQTVTES